MIADNSITFFSVRGRGLNQDLTVVQKALRKKLPDMVFQYYTNSEVSDSDIVVKKCRAARKNFCKYVHSAICMDSSVPLQFVNTGEKDKRLFIAALYDYFFEVALQLEKDPDLTKRKTYTGCNFILPGSPFAANILKRGYELSQTNIDLLDNICLPLSWDLAQPENRAAKRKVFDYFYRGMKNKKVIAFIMADPEEEAQEEYNPFIYMQLKKLLDDVKNEYFVITNSLMVKSSADNLPASYMDSFGVAKKRLSALDLLYVADVVITNNSRFATGAAAIKKPVYVVNYRESKFIEFMKVFYPGMYLSEVNDILNIDFHSMQLTKEQEKFCKEFSYATDINPLNVITDFFR